jgi:hypothetical protein
MSDNAVSLYILFNDQKIFAVVASPFGGIYFLVISRLPSNVNRILQEHATILSWRRGSQENVWT